MAIFYEEGKGGEDYAKKNKFRCQIDGKEKSSVRMKNSVTEFAGLRETAKKLGLWILSTYNLIEKQKRMVEPNVFQ